MAGELTAPLVPGVSSFGAIMANATQAAAVQSAQILSAARNIAADRQRAGEMAADAVVRMRLEDFQKEQFRQKKTIEDAHLAISLATSRRLEAREPLERQLLQAEIDQAPLRTALIGAQLTGTQLRNTQDAGDLLEAPAERVRQARFNEARASSAELDYSAAQGEFDKLNNAERDIGLISALLSDTDLTSQTDLNFALNSLKSLKDEAESGGESSVLDNPRVTALYNKAVEKIAPTDDARDILLIPEDVVDALRPQTSLGLREGTESRIRLESEMRAKVGAAESKIKSLKSQKEALKSNNSKDAKTKKTELDGLIQTQEAAKAAAQIEFTKKLQELTASNGFLPAGPREIDPTLVNPTPGTPSAVQQYLGNIR